MNILPALIKHCQYFAANIDSENAQRINFKIAAPIQLEYISTTTSVNKTWRKIEEINTKETDLNDKHIKQKHTHFCSFQIGVASNLVEVYRFLLTQIENCNCHYQTRFSLLLTTYIPNHPVFIRGNRRRCNILLSRNSGHLVFETSVREIKQTITSQITINKT